MRLQRLVLSGFKTFAHRTEIRFEPGITGVVGPNGSGKSNLVDAVRWALGETNARELRGSRLDEMIFAGGSGRDRMGVAEVELILDNEDGGSRSRMPRSRLSRRVVRGGDVEYRINGERTRLRDVERILGGTGLTQHGYAVVAQHDIEAIIEATPRQRRSLVEQAAGVRPLRVACDDALRRLEQVGVAVQRLVDRLGELEPRLAELAGEREAALEQRGAWRSGSPRCGGAWPARPGERRAPRSGRRAGGWKSADRRLEAATEAETGVHGAGGRGSGRAGDGPGSAARAAERLEAARVAAERCRGEARRFADRAWTAALHRADARRQARRAGGGGGAAHPRAARRFHAGDGRRLAERGEVAGVATPNAAAPRRRGGRGPAGRGLGGARAGPRRGGGRGGAGGCPELAPRSANWLEASLRAAAERAARRPPGTAPWSWRPPRPARPRRRPGGASRPWLGMEARGGGAAAALSREAEERDRGAGADDRRPGPGRQPARPGGRPARRRPEPSEPGRSSWGRSGWWTALRVRDAADAPAVEAALEPHLGAWVVDDLDRALSAAPGRGRSRGGADRRWGGDRPRVGSAGVDREVPGAGQEAQPAPLAWLSPCGRRAPPRARRGGGGSPGQAAAAHCLAGTWLVGDLGAARRLAAGGARAVLPDGAVITARGARAGGGRHPPSPWWPRPARPRRPPRPPPPSRRSASARGAGAARMPWRPPIRLSARRRPRPPAQRRRGREAAAQSTAARIAAARRRAG